MSESDTSKKPDWQQVLISQAQSIKLTTWVPFGFGLMLVGVIWVRDWSKPAALQDSATNPARAVTSDRAATASGELLLPDQLNLAFQQLVADRSQQIKADIARETADAKTKCFKLAPAQCLESKLRRLNQQMSEAIADDGSMRVSPSRALALNVEAQAMLMALSGLGAKDEETLKFQQVYLPAAQAGDSSTVLGMASTVQSLDLYLERRKVDRLSAAGKTEDIPERKRIGNVRSASALGN